MSKIYGGQIPIVLLLPYIRANSFSIMASDHDFVPPLKKKGTVEKKKGEVGFQGEKTVHTIIITNYYVILSR